MSVIRCDTQGVAPNQRHLATRGMRPMGVLSPLRTDLRPQPGDDTEAG
jgi:hypothetical protein